MYKRIPKSLLSKRTVVVGLLVLLQAAILILGIWYLSDYHFYFTSLLGGLSVLVVVYIINEKKNPSYQLAWVIPILIFPLFGGLLYVLYHLQSTTKLFKRRMGKLLQNTRPLLKQEEALLQALERQSREAANQARYLYTDAHCPVFRGTTVDYLSPGERKFERLLEELSKAEHFIFLEYFIIEDGVMWNAILKILIEKARQGVEVRLMYDGMGCLSTLAENYWKTMEAVGIHCIEFNPVVPILSTLQNNRDHRKIAVIDGHTAFTGGINLADEYINAYERFGHWKDASVMLKGEAVWSLTLMFLQIWNMSRNQGEDLEQYRPHRYHPEPFEDDGFVLPYCDSPLDNIAVGENAYLNLIGKAKRYVYINTPYFIVDFEMMTALTLAAKSGVDVRIVTPHHPDKWYVHIVTRSYYRELLEAGIRVYEYTPGFIHSKTVVVDDEMATVGTQNFDYRSLYLHFECGVWMYRSRAVEQLKADFLTTLKVCAPMTLEDCKRIKWYHRVLSSVLRLFAPLM